MGTFPIGDFNLKASKKMEGKTFDGAINITMSEEDGIAKESFRQKRFNVTTEGGSMLDDINIYVNDKMKVMNLIHLVLMILTKMLSYMHKVL